MVVMYTCSALRLAYGSFNCDKSEKPVTSKYDLVCGIMMRLNCVMNFFHVMLRKDVQGQSKQSHHAKAILNQSIGRTGSPRRIQVSMQVSGILKHPPHLQTGSFS